LVATAIPTFQVPSAAFLIFDAIQFFAPSPKGSSELDGVSDATISEKSRASSSEIPESFR